VPLTETPELGNEPLYQPVACVSHKFDDGTDVISRVPAAPLKRTQVTVELKADWSQVLPPAAVVKRVASVMVV
jgi:hypothetical protein